MRSKTALRIGGFLAVGVIATAALVDLRPWRPPEAQIRVALHAEGPIRAGAGRAIVELPREVPLAGYRPFGRTATGEREPIFARALVLEAGGVRTGLVLLELMTLPASLSERIARSLREEGIECALVAATHTHTGPGGYDRALIPQALAVGRFDARVEAALVDAVKASVAQAAGSLAEARIFAGEGRAALARNRDRKGAPVDDRLLRIEIRQADESPIATLIRMAAHPTIAAREERSGDWPAQVMRSLEEGGGIGFVLQGAVGDALVRGKREVRCFGERVLQAAEALPLERIDEPPVLGCRLADFTLPPPDLSAMLPRPFVRIASNAALLFAPETSQVVGLHLGQLTLVGVPGEPTAAVGSRLEAAGGRVRTVGLAMDYTGYLVEPADMEDRVFSARNAYFGAELTDRILDVAARIGDAPPASGARHSEAIAP